MFRRRVSNENDAAICSGLIDHSDKNWREAARAELLEDDVDVSDDVSREKDDDFDKEAKPPAIKSLTEAMKVAEQLWPFVQLNGHQELALSLAMSNDLNYALKL